jgi:6-phosphogluconolactonase
MGVTERFFPNADDLNQALAEDIAATLNAAALEQDRISLVASGGTSPGDMYEYLAELDLPWKQLDVVPSDERWVGIDTLTSNYRLLATHLMRGDAARAHLVSLKSDHETPELGEEEIDQRVAAIHRPFDVTLLGMGLDSHIAGLIPGTDALDAALDTDDQRLVCAVRAHGSNQDRAGTDMRMTLTLRAFLNSRRIILLFFGENKLAVYRAALTGSDVSLAPVRGVLFQSRIPVDVYWAP